jgi:hypothetical protein
MRESVAPLSGLPAAWAVHPNRLSTRIEGRPASPKARRMLSHGVEERVEMWKSTTRISTFPQRRVSESECLISRAAS